jgi:hypothetical protein
VPLACGVSKGIVLQVAPGGNPAQEMETIWSNFWIEDRVMV